MSVEQMIDGVPVPEMQLMVMKALGTQLDALRTWQLPSSPDAEHGDTKFYALPSSLQRWMWGPCKCGCINPAAWDTLAIGKDGKRYTVHYPELHVG